MKRHAGGVRTEVARRRRADGSTKFFNSLWPIFTQESRQRTVCK